MPGGVGIFETPGQPNVDTDADFSACIIGYSSLSPVASGQVTPPYSKPEAAASDLGAGDAVGVLVGAIAVTPGNPAPTPPCSFYSTPATNAGTYGTINTSGVVGGTATPSNHTAVTPLETLDPWMLIATDTILGTGGTAHASLNGGRHRKLVQLGTSLTYDFPASDGWGVDGRAGFTLGTSSQTLSAGDVFYTHTVAPQWDVDDLFDASDPDDIVGAFASIARSSMLFGRIYLAEPMAAGDFSAVVAGLDYGLSLDKRWKLTARFRDPTDSETDSEYILAFQAFVAACRDNRIEYLAGSAYISDALTGHVYLRTFMDPYAARNASFKNVPGQAGERLTQNAGWVARGPLERCTLKDSNGVTIGHDESVRGGIVSDPGAATGGGVALCYRSNVQVAGTYVDDGATVAYPVLSTILVPGDRALANALETLAVGISLLSIGGAAIFSDGTPHVLDPIIADGLEQKIGKAIRDNYGKEFQNADDPGLVTIDPNVTVTGQAVAITGELRIRFFGYIRTIVLRFTASR